MKPISIEKNQPNVEKKEITSLSSNTLRNEEMITTLLNKTYISLAYSNEFKHIKTKCKRNILSVLYDSDVFDIINNTSEFHKRIMMKPHLVFLLQTKNGISFGLYNDYPIEHLYDDKNVLQIHKTFKISEHGNILRTQSNAFLFTLKDGKCKTFRYLNKQAHVPIRLYIPESQRLFFIGQLDVSVFKNIPCLCNQQSSPSFDYENNPNALIGTNKFFLKRLLVLEMGLLLSDEEDNNLKVRKDLKSLVHYLPMQDL